MNIFKHFHACQLKQGKPRRFLFPIGEHVIGEFNYVLLLDVTKLRYGSVLRVIHIGTVLQSGSFINKIDTNTAWRMSKSVSINMYAGRPDYIHTDPRTNFNSEWFK